ncbi:hypothetical protein HS088_TW19G00558 [Tripterygium wilfordii]|uniref:Uncharacterized protein n=1 Tax=Tripterygium wilfordii TaxID=458696 RepID=A0A7J7CAK2_TRIWF|nr:hypothetical protein HS088_TW19G00558 [Tripterygium wilfordii]
MNIDAKPRAEFQPRRSKLKINKRVHNQLNSVEKVQQQQIWKDWLISITTTTWNNMLFDKD